MSADTAIRLAGFFGTSEMFWMHLQAAHDLDIAKLALPPLAASTSGRDEDHHSLRRSREKHAVQKRRGWMLRRCRDEDGNDRQIVARRMKVLQVERLVPHLIERRGVKRRRAHLELDSEYDTADQQHNIDPPARARDAVFKEDRPPPAR